MSAEWREYYIDEIKADEASSIAIGPFGSRMKSDCYVESGVRVVRGTNLTSGMEFSGEFVFVTAEKAAELGGANLEPFDLVFPHRGAIGEVGIVPCDGERYVLSSSLMKLRCNRKKADPNFIFYFFKSALGRFELLKNASQVGTPGIGQPLTSLKGIRLKLPLIEEQQRIAGVLGVFDDRIALLRETNATLEAMAQALFKSWFVDFDPVHANAGTRAATLPADLQALFPSTFTDTPQGLVPEGWRVGTIAELADLNPESWTAKKHPVTVAYIDLANAKDNVIADIAEFDFDAAPSRARRVLRDGDTIVGTVRPGNRSFAFIQNAADNLTGSTGFAVLRPKHQRNTAFIYLAATNDNSIDHLTHVADGGAYPAVRSEVVASLSCSCPPLEVLEAFNAVAAELLMKIAKNHQQAQTLATLRDTLLPRLISGQLRLPDVVAALAEVDA